MKVGDSIIQSVPGTKGMTMKSARPKLVVIGIAAAIVFLTKMIIMSKMTNEISKAKDKSGCDDDGGLKNAYNWGVGSSVVYGLIAAFLFLGSGALIASYYI